MNYDKQTKTTEKNPVKETVEKQPKAVTKEPKKTGKKTKRLDASLCVYRSSFRMILPSRSGDTDTRHTGVFSHDSMNRT